MTPAPGGDQRARRAGIFAALRALLLDRPWGEVTLEAVARDAGVSRQTLYNSFGSRNGLAQAYTLHLADALCDVIAAAVAARPEDPLAGLEDGVRGYLELADDDPLFARVRSGEAHQDLVRLVTTDAEPLLARVAERLGRLVGDAWPELDDATTTTLGRVLARFAVSLVAIPPVDEESPAAVAAGLSSMLAGLLSGRRRT